MFTDSPTFLSPRVVAARVSGMRDTSNQLSAASAALTALTVRDTPSTAIEPLFVTSADSSGARVSRSTRQAPPSATESTVLVPSMWPCTMCPPRRSPRRTARSRLTWVPVAGVCSVLIAIVSAMTSAVNLSSPTSTTVRQTPFTEIESPSLASDTASGPRTVSRAASGDGCQSTTSPSSSMIPVNTMTLPFPAA